jgi:hypothetical protein
MLVTLGLTPSFGASSRGVAANRPSPANAAAQKQKQDQVRLVQLAQLAGVDRRVRAHEQAHLAVAGPYALGGPSYTYQTGPDGKQYAVGGEVAIDASPIPGDPQATLAKERTVQAAANAPADPSTQDRQVAAQAAIAEQQALMDIAKQSNGSAPASGQIFSITA